MVVTHLKTNVGRGSAHPENQVPASPGEAWSEGLQRRLSGKKTNPHLVRDMIVTHLKTSGASEQELEALALFMGHSQAMQRSTYDRCLSPLLSAAATHGLDLASGVVLITGASLTPCLQHAPMLPIDWGCGHGSIAAAMIAPQFSYPRS